MKSYKKRFILALCCLVGFALWTMAIRLMDVQAIGPNGSKVGFAVLNGAVHRLTGVHMTLYTITDWLGLVPVAFGFGFALLGLCQWLRRKWIWKVDSSILVLGIFYLAVLGVYLLFEQYVVNYRPVLIAGYLEASYPSSTTLLVMCVMPTAMMQLKGRIKGKPFRRIALWGIGLFTAFMVAGRLFSGVHWFTDIIGAALLSAGLVLLYDAFCKLFSKR